LVDAFSDVNVDGAQGVSQWWWRGRRSRWCSLV
jgi:hypothetical protein